MLDSDVINVRLGQLISTSKQTVPMLLSTEHIWSDWHIGVAVEGFGAE